jgi:hypothetical protein
LDYDEFFRVFEQKYSEGMNYAYISTGVAGKAGIEFSQQDFIDWAKFLADKKVYLLNTDFDHKIDVTIDYGTHKKELVIEPCEFKAVEND